MTVFTDGPRTAEYLISEAANFRSRDVASIDATGGALVAGAVLGKIALGAAIAAAQGGNTGNATISAVTRGAGAKVGVYAVEFLTATTFEVIDPDGFRLKPGATGVAYADDLGFTITAGGTPMVAGDGFNITVAAGSGKFVQMNAAATDGSQTASAILFEGIGAVEAERTITARDAEVKASKLTWFTGANTNQKNAGIAALAAVGIIVR
jgi:hypothetical protein